MKKTLLLCFVHGFKGGDDTFGDFPFHLETLLAAALPNITVQSIVYPKFETRGDLNEYTREKKLMGYIAKRLLEKVIDLEVSNNTPSPTIDPSVRTILVGHSMGGIVAADTILSIASEQPIESAGSDNTSPHPNTMMFPYIQGVLAFDTPYLGISPGVVAHGAEGHYNAASSAITQLSGLTGAFWGTKAATADAKSKKPVAALPAPPTSPNTTASPWQKWGKLAVAAGGVAAVAGAGAAAFVNRDKLTEGWSWVGSHLEFVGCLMKGEELRKRVSGMVSLNKELKVGWGNLYTRLGKQAVSKNDGSMVGGVIGNQRTFCNLPKTEAKAYWYEAINDNAKDETGAHMTMFFPKENPGYSILSDAAKNLIVEWTKNDWYESSTDTDTWGNEQEL
ncbi:Uncharacterized protein BP5553_03868 [Venustampulla echinocandica]|uniref:DUF676 domain-containing protein n=1 Tax=Venustampulla echinocandica TaxID=2656787 RepID=A0A370TVM9_9HELO|nr:Uncharacterized protein BP5553_03868 [Venustampulla echinocandica]RDL39528.1 Uncharacterized protein BP5553_03868 [Venustampulla echinocandica]